MTIIDQLSFGLKHKIPVTLQTEATECGLACLAMIAGYHGYRTDLATLRKRYAVSQKGATLAQLIHIANSLQLVTRPLKLELEDLPQLTLPCILHWDFNHFVVLSAVSRNGISIIDPAMGQRQLGMEEVSRHFTGVALELSPSLNFEKKEEKQNIKLWSLLGNMRGIWTMLGQILVLALVLEVFTLVSPFFMQWVIDQVIVSADRDLLTTLALGFGLLMVLQQLIGALRSWMMLYMGTTLNVQWRANVFKHLIQLPVQYFEKRHLGDVISRFGAIDHIQGTLTSTFMEAVLDGLMTVFTLLLMFVYSPKLAMIAVITMSLYGLIRWIWYRPLRAATEEEIIHEAKQHTHFMESMRGIKTIKLFQRQDIRQSAWLAIMVDQVNAGLTTQKLSLAFRIVNGLLFGVENILVIWLGATFVLDGNFSVGALMAFIAYKNLFDSRVGSLIDKFVEVKMLNLQGERLADIVLTEQENRQATQTILLADDFNPDIRVEGLSYQYSAHEPFILKDASFEIAAGESVAIVGPTGGGKTTLLNILLGVIPLSTGEIKLGGISVRQLGLDSMRSMVATVLQDDVLFTGSIADNISFFDPHEDAAWVEHCARLAAVHEDIIAMPMAYRTLVGDMGTALSGGQKQRILLARALYKKPKILLMDEATSNLDVQKEQEVNANIQSLNMTRIFIAHRPETIASADRVLYLQDGQVISQQQAMQVQAHE